MPYPDFVQYSGPSMWVFADRDCPVSISSFGLCNAPATFQHLMGTVLAGLQWERCLVYLDDIILEKTFDDHIAAHSQVLEQLEQAGLKLKPSECHLYQAEVSYLGHLNRPFQDLQDSQLAYSNHRSRGAAIKDNYYRCFIQDFATLAWPLHRLTEKGRLFHWTPACEQAFADLKGLLVSASILAMFLQHLHQLLLFD